MELFNELKNEHILNSILMINRIFDKEIIKWSNFELFFLQKNDKDYPSSKYDYIDQLREEYGLFRKDENDLVKLVYDSDIKIRTNLYERIWLKSILEYPDIKLFIEEKTINKLKNQLQDEDEYKIDGAIIRKGQSGNGDQRNEQMCQKIGTLIQAIHEKRILIYSNRIKNGDVFLNKKSIVYKIEYSIIEDRFRVSLWSLDEERPIKANLNNLFDLSLGEVTERPYETVSSMIESRKADEIIKLRITNENNCVERAVLLFSQYERITRWEDDETLLMEISYYKFDEDELFRNILSLGPLAVVLQPESLRKRIIETISRF